MRKKIYLIFLFVCSYSSILLAQTATISGKVTNKGEPVPGASVMVVGQTIGTSSDADGKFKINNVPVGSSFTLRAGGIGFKNSNKTLSLKSGESLTINFELEDDAKFLDEVVVTGLSINAKQKELGTSRSNINSSTIESLPAPSVENALVGRLAGVEAFTTDGAPGGGFRFRIRGGNSISGASEPLVIIDGIFMDNANRNSVTGAAGGNNATGAATFGMANGTRGLGALNPEDIESIEVLKGAAAASLYGSRAASGVIVVKTKGGGNGKLKLDYSLDIGSMEVSRNVGKYKTQWTANEIDQWANLINPTKSVYTDANIAQYKINPTMDYTMDPFRKGTFSRHTVRVQGGTKQFGYYFSGNLQNTMGHIKGTQFDTKGALLSLSSEPVTGLSLKLNINYQDADRFQVASGTPGFFVPNRWANDTGTMPFMRYTDAKTNVAGVKSSDDYALIRRENMSKRVTVSGNLNYKIFKSLSVDVTAGIDQSKIDGFMVYPLGLVSIFPTGRLDRDYEKLSQKTFTAGLNHVLQVSEKFYVKSAVGVQYDENDRFYDYARYQGLVVGRDYKDSLSYNAPQRAAFFQVAPLVKTLGIYVNETIGIGSKLFLNLGGRFDRSTSFVEQTFFYPRASVSYQVAPTVRVRGAYGMSGTQPAPYQSTPTYRSVAGGYNGSATNYVPNTPPNADGLKPETQTEIEFGFDASLMQGRINIEMTYYNKMFKDLLLNTSINPALNLGLVSGIRNVGSMYNRGLEMTINAAVIQTKDWNWNVSLTASTLENKVTKMPFPPTPIIGGIDNIVQIREGYPISGIWAGVPVSSAGDAPAVATVAGGPARVYMGNTQPKFEGNFNTSLSYQGFTVSALIGGKAGFFKYNQTARDMANPTKRQHEDYWSLPTADLTTLYNDQTRWVQRADFIKLRQLTLSYTVPKQYLEQSRYIKRLNLGFTGANLFTYTKFSGAYDVESETNGSSASGASWAWTRGIDSWDGGIPKSYTFSLNVGF